MLRVALVVLAAAVACGNGSDGSDGDGTPRCVAVIGDECYDDERLTRFFLVDMEAQDLGTDASRACMAPGLVDLVREHGFSDVFVDRPVAVPSELNELRATCGID